MVQAKAYDDFVDCTATLWQMGYPFTETNPMFSPNYDESRIEFYEKRWSKMVDCYFPHIVQGPDRLTLVKILENLVIDFKAMNVKWHDFFYDFSKIISFLSERGELESFSTTRMFGAINFKDRLSENMNRPPYGLSITNIYENLDKLPDVDTFIAEFAKDMAEINELTTKANLLRKMMNEAIAKKCEDAGVIDNDNAESYVGGKYFCTANPDCTTVGLE